MSRASERSLKSPQSEGNAPSDVSQNKPCSTFSLIHTIIDKSLKFCFSGYQMKEMQQVVKVGKQETEYQFFVKQSMPLMTLMIQIKKNHNKYLNVFDLCFILRLHSLVILVCVPTCYWYYCVSYTCSEIKMNIWTITNIIFICKSVS